MKTIPLLLAMSASLPAIAAPAPDVRIETVARPAGGAVRLLVKDGPKWRTVLESDATPSTKTTLNTLAMRPVKTPREGTAYIAAGWGGGSVTTWIRAGAGRVNVESTLNLTKLVPVEAIVASWHFAPDGQPQRPDFTWTPNLRPNADEVIGMHVFRSPAAIAQKGGISAVLLPDLNVLDRNWRALPATLDLDVTDRAGTRLSYVLQEHDVVRHVYWRHEKGRTRMVGPGTVKLAYTILLGARTPPRMAYRQAARWWWDVQGRRNLQDPLPQSVPWERYADVGINAYMLPLAWRDGTMDGEAVGGVGMDSWGYRSATWFQCWFNDLRSAYGLYLWGRRLGRPELVEKARRTRALLLHSPQRQGLFPVIYDWDTRKWAGSAAGGGANVYHTADCAWAAYWLLKWDQELERSADSVDFCRRLGDFLVGAQLPSGEIPSYYDIGTMEVIPRLRGGAETTASAMFLAYLGRVTGEKAYTAAARRGAEYVRRSVWPRNRWYDYETFYSCSGKPETFVDKYTDQNPQNNLSIQWAAELFRQLYLADHKPQDLRDGEAILDYLNLYQQVWSPSYMTFAGFGGYGVQNTDAEWDDARLAQFACTNIDYYALTGKPEYMERGIAGLRSGFATVYMPENRFVSPRTYQKTPEGYADENYGHGGVDAPAGPTSWDWGTGSALASVAYARQRYGDVWVDATTHKAFGLDGVTATWAGGKLSVTTAIQRIAPVTVRGGGKGLPVRLTVNGAARALTPADWRAGWTVTPIAEPRIRHRAPAMRMADAVTLEGEVWPASPRAFAVNYRVSTRDGNATSGDALGVSGNDGRFSIRLPAEDFPDAGQTMRYTLTAGNATSGPFETEVKRLGAEAELWRDTFAPGSLDARWRVETPEGGMARAGEDGLTISVPGDRPFDQWDNASNAPRVTCAVPAGEWTFRATVDTKAGPEGALWQAGVFVPIAERDGFYYGPFRGSALTLERAGKGTLASDALPPGTDRVELRVRRTADGLWFDWRPAGGAWRDATIVAAPAPQRVGMLLKTWGPNAAAATFTEAAMARLMAAGR
ncbi:MAG TPA: hypothetical protein VGM37_01490 [Armatimonadota bacterium]|jgi:hypothetical protein